MNAALAQEVLAKFPEVDGWKFNLESFDGDTETFIFERGEITVLATPDFDEEGMIAIEYEVEGERSPHADDITYEGELTAEKYVSLMRPWLAKIREEEDARENA